MDEVLPGGQDGVGFVRSCGACRPSADGSRSCGGQTLTLDMIHLAFSTVIEGALKLSRHCRPPGLHCPDTTGWRLLQYASRRRRMTWSGSAMSSFETAVMPAFLLFWVSFPFGFQLVLHQFSLGTSCPFRGGVLTSAARGSLLRYRGLNTGNYILILLTPIYDDCCFCDVTLACSKPRRICIPD